MVVYLLQPAKVYLIKVQNGVFSSIARVLSGSHRYGTCKCGEAAAS